MFEFSVVEADAIEATDIAKFAVGKSIDFLNEYVFYAFLTEIKFADERVARAKWVFVGHLDAGNDKVNLLLVERRKTYIVFDKEFMASVLVVVLVVGVVDDAL